MNLLMLLEGPAGNVLTDAAKSALGDKRQAYTLAFIGLAGTLIPVVLSWTKDIGISSQRAKQLDEGMKRIAFWEQWLKLSSTLGDEAAESARTCVRQELELLSAALSSSSALIHSEAFALQKLKSQFKSKLAGISSVRRMLLLYKPPRPLAWVPRFFFYFFSFTTFLELIFELYALLDKTATDRSAIIGGFLIFIVFTTLVTVGFRYLSLSLEKPHKTMTDVSIELPPSPI